MVERLRQARPQGHYRRWATWWLWVLVYVADAASGAALRYVSLFAPVGSRLSSSSSKSDR